MEETREVKDIRKVNVTFNTHLDGNSVYLTFGFSGLLPDASARLDKLKLFISAHLVNAEMYSSYFSFENTTYLDAPTVFEMNKVLIMAKDSGLLHNYYGMWEGYLLKLFKVFSLEEITINTSDGIKTFSNKETLKAFNLILSETISTSEKLQAAIKEKASSKVVF